MDDVCNKVFPNWSWVTNSDLSRKGCRIAIGWDPHSISDNLLASNAQVMHFEVTIIRDNKKFLYLSFMVTMKPRKELICGVT